MERQRKPVDTTLLEQLSDWASPIFDPQFGDGATTDIRGAPSERAVGVTIFPDTQVALIHTRLFSTTIRRAEGEYDEHNEALFLRGVSEEEWVSASITRRGVVFLTSTPYDRSKYEVPASLLQTYEQEMEAAASPPPAESLAAGLREAVAEHTEKQKALRLTGRVATEPKYYDRRTQTGKDPLTVAFQFVVHTEGEPDQYHVVQAYGARARQLQEEGFLKRGAEVFVVGYPKTFPRQHQGKTTEQAGLNATLIRPAEAKRESE